ncbi:MAG: LamG domain-containing protein [Planctomycetes bacterium]|nr:LamG domain-containing protein [Planctomycetota bacterium]
MNRKRNSILVFCSLLTLIAGNVRADLMAHWRLDDGIGTMALDSSGNDRHAEMVGAPTWAAGFMDGALQTSLGNYLVVPGYTGVLGAEPRTCTAWIQTATAPGVIFGWGLITNGTKWIVRINNGGQLRCEVDGGYQYANTSLIDNEWHHVAAVLNAEAPNVEDVLLYVDGIHDGTNADVSARAINTIEDMDVTLGQNPHSLGTRWFDGLLDDMRIYNQALTVGEVQAVMLGKGPGVAAELAGQPSPDEEAIDISRDVVLSWVGGEFAATHTVYFGTAFDDVNNADVTDSLGVLVSQAQSDTTYDADVLDFGQTYYWRVDEVNSAPDFTVFKGATWSFTTEPFSIPITSITATASSSFGASVAENTINGSGLVDDLHGVSAPDMWISGGIPATIEYAFDRAYKLHELWVWNSNQTIEPFIGFGAKDIVIEHSLDGENWTVLDDVGPLEQGSGLADYAHNNTIGFGGAVAQYVRMTVNSVQGFAPQASLSEVRFFSIPTFATRPNPESGATDVAPDLVLSWGRNGREAGRHDIYVGSDPNTLPLAGSVTESSFDTLALDLQLDETYSWRVDEVNEAMDPSTWTGDIWNFTTVNTIIVDDMESYRDEEFFEIWATWIDGFDDPVNNGAVVGAIPSLGDFSPETTIVNGGSQSLPIHFDNSGAPRSEAARIFAASQDWSKHGVQGLVLSFHGSLANSGGRLYVKINDTQVVYDGDPADLQRIGWHKWYIDLAALPAATRGGVNSLTLGIDSGGAGVIYIDDILLTPDARELITPAELSPEGLVVYYPFDGNFQDASGNGLHGAGMGGPLFEPGHSGQAISLDGAGQYVEITGYQGISAVDGVQQPFSISNWFATIANGEMVTWGSTPGGQRLSWRIESGNLRTEHGNGNLRGNTLVNDGEWHHGALVVQEGANLRVPNTTIYIDGLADGVNSGDDDPYNLTPGVDVSIGRRATSNDRFFPGSIDEVRIFDRALSAAEVAGLAGRTEPFDKP